MAAIEIHGLSKCFGDVVAVEDLSFGVRAGAVTGFLGPNGAGKSTTLRMLLGLVRPTRGGAVIAGRPYAEHRRPVRHVGAVLESDSFHPGRRARDHLRVLATAAELPLSRVDAVLAGRRARCPGRGGCWAGSGPPPRPAGVSRASRSGCASASGWPARCSASR